MKNFTKTLLPAIALSLGIFANASAQKMYWANPGVNKIQRADIDGSNVEDLIDKTGAPLGFGPNGIAIDATNSKMYWTNRDNAANASIHRSDLDGSNEENLITTGLNNPEEIALDVPSGKMYWADSGTNKIQRANLDGSSVEDLITGVNGARGMDLDLTSGKMYFTDTGTFKVARADLDGSNVEDLVTGLAGPQSVALDLTAGKMYYIESENFKIHRANLDGSSTETLKSGIFSLARIAVDSPNGKMYWTEGNSHKIQRANLNGSSTEDLVTGLSFPKGIALGPDDTPLSVELNSFSARQIENSISLTWSTASETENEGFNIYRKTNESNFIQIASHKSHRELQGQGNTSIETFYTFVDNSELQSGELYTYVVSDVETNGLETKHEEMAQSVFFEATQNQSVKRFKLAQNFPNPFNPNTTISFTLAKDSNVSLKIYNENGGFVKELTSGFSHEGSHSINWNGTDQNGNLVSSGTYFYKIEAGNFVQTNKMILLK
ncbi:MAG: T9SS C-terminal target domain-containing protein [Calditrichaeota bacterium]|nr:MAG: T9SS C-terminal target domain-containing protein [Calditrichota bacterium]